MADLVLSALEQLWRALQPLRLPMAVMGGLAVSFWKHVRATQDVDILVGLAAEEESTVIAVLRTAGFRVKHDPAVMQLGELRLLQLLVQPPGSYLDIQVDLLLVSTEFHRRALTRKVPVRLPGQGMEVEVLTCEDLILYKLIAGRILDRADVHALLRANAQSLDMDYLARTSSDLGVRSDLEAILTEALPGRSLA